MYGEIPYLFIPLPTWVHFTNVPNVKKVSVVHRIKIISHTSEKSVCTMFLNQCSTMLKWIRVTIYSIASLQARFATILLTNTNTYIYICYFEVNLFVISLVNNMCQPPNSHKYIVLSHIFWFLCLLSSKKLLKNFQVCQILGQ